MKRIIFCFAISSLLLINNVSAQDNSLNNRLDSLINKKLVRMQKELNLTQQQQNSIKVVMLDNNQKNQQLKKDIDAIRELKKQNDRNAEKELAKILTADQYQKYQERKSMLKSNKKETRIKEKMAYYRDELKLSDQQYNDLKIMIEKAEFSKIEMKDKFKDNNEMMKKELKKIKTENKEQLKKILNKDQLLKLKELHKSAKSL